MCPRDALAKVLIRFKDLDIGVLAGAEMEFRMLQSNNEEPFSEPNYCSQFSYSLQEDVLFYIELHLYFAGIDIESMHIESGMGIFEFTIKPEEGVKAADGVFFV